MTTQRKTTTSISYTGKNEHGLDEWIAYRSNDDQTIGIITANRTNTAYTARPIVNHVAQPGRSFDYDITLAADYLGAYDKLETFKQAEVKTGVMKSYVGMFNQRHINYVTMMSELRNFAEVTLDERNFEFSTENCIKDEQPTGHVRIYVTETMSDEHKQTLRTWLEGFKAAANYKHLPSGARYPLTRK